MEIQEDQDFRTIKNIGESIDRKFKIEAKCVEHGHLHSDFDSVLFLAKDKALPDTLRYYREKCRELGAEPQQIEGITLLIERVEKWQQAHRRHVKVADIDLPAGESIIAPNK